MSQRTTPAENTPNIPHDKSFVDLVFLILIICGTKETEVKIPATIPNTSE